jgi:hypothetical protein
MTQVTVPDPDKVDTKHVGQDGRIYLGKENAGREVQVVLKYQDRDDEDDADVAAEVSDG